MSRCVVVMGVAGSGKSRVGAALAERLGWRFIEADDLHPPANVDKMHRGIPLDDDDRAPWLAALNGLLCSAQQQGDDVVLACSALKHAYRERLRAGIDDLSFVYLHGDADLIAARLRTRSGHFMRDDMLASQLADLEEPSGDEALRVEIDEPIDAIVDQIAARVRAAESERG